MRRSLLALSIALVVVLMIVGLWQAVPTAAQPAGGSSAVAGGSAVPPGPQLPIAQVILFSSGVGYFQREGEIDGDARIDISFPVEDINDLLKSMVLRDLGGGHITAVNYDSHDPVEKTLQSFAINLNNNPSFADILKQARGEKVEVVLQQSNVTQPQTLVGSIISVEKKGVPKGKDGSVEVEVVNLWCADGVRSIRLSEVQRIRFLNPVIDQELRRALETLALSHDTRKKTVSLLFTGRGTRPVRVGYVVEAPIWKTSYRLVLDDDGKPFLQGWAIVENSTDEDWSNVRVALVSGRPISFQMDLYEPLYVPRPTVEPELFASLRPVTYGGSMTERDKAEMAADVPPAAPAEMLRRDSLRALQKRQESKGKRRALGFQGAVGGFAGKPGAAKKNDFLDEKLSLGQSVASAATATEMGDYFQYIIDHPVTLPRQKSAMLPIVNHTVEAKRVSIYNQATHAKFPLLGLKFKNVTGVHLMQGPITVFDGNSYAGDARILDLQPGEERLISYAIDLGTEVEPIVEHKPQRLVAARIYKGILIATHKLRETKKYRIKNRSNQDRLVIIEHPYRPQFRLVTPEKPAERSRDFYRFELAVAAGKSGELAIAEEQDLQQQIQLRNANDQTIRIFLQSQVVSDRVKEALARAMELKGQLAKVQREIADLNRDLQEIHRDQQRLRSNLREMPPTAAAYKRYLDKFDRQESEIEQMHKRLKELRTKEAQHRETFERYLASLNVS